MLIKDLGGHSGCKILLFEENGGYFVRKISASTTYNDRLKAQCKKQASFFGNSIKAPKIIKDGYNDDGLYYFDMEYVKGVTLAKYISKMDVSEINGLVSLIIDNINFDSSPCNSVDTFKDKLEDIKSKTHSLKNAVIDRAVDYLMNYDWTNFSNSPCHGDLTLENIIVKNGELYFIDFLDSFYDSWLIDIGKLLQDAECFWSFRNDETMETNTKLRLIIFKKIIFQKLESINPKFLRDSYVSLLFALIRIYPYAKDNETYSFLDKQVSNVMDKIERYTK